MTSVLVTCAGVSSCNEAREVIPTLGNSRVSRRRHAIASRLPVIGGPGRDGHQARSKVGHSGEERGEG